VVNDIRQNLRLKQSGRLLIEVIASAQVAKWLGTTTHSLYAWKKKYSPDSAGHQIKTESDQEIRPLKQELRRVTEERDILKKAAVYFVSSPNEVHFYQG
jgi:transposase